MYTYIQREREQAGIYLIVLLYMRIVFYMRIVCYMRIVFSQPHATHAYCKWGRKKPNSAKKYTFL